MQYPKTKSAAYIPYIRRIDTHVLSVLSIVTVRKWKQRRRKNREKKLDMRGFGPLSPRLWRRQPNILGTVHKIQRVSMRARGFCNTHLAVCPLTLHARLIWQQQVCKKHVSTTPSGTFSTTFFIRRHRFVDFVSHFFRKNIIIFCGNKNDQQKPFPASARKE